jgi:hypothetical protein
MLFPVKFQPPTADLGAFGSFPTDKLSVYLGEAAQVQRFNLFVATMLLMWRAPGASQVAPAPAATSSSVELDDFKQNDPSSGYVMVRYNLVGGPGKLRLRLYAAADPATANYFAVQDQKVQAGRSLQMLEFSVKPDAPSPSDVIKADTFEIELLDASGKVLATVKKQVPMTWTKPK